MSCQKIVTSSLFFAFLANLEQSGGRILDTEDAKVLFSVIVTLDLQKLKTELKNLQHRSHTIALNKGYFFG